MATRKFVDDRSSDLGIGTRAAESRVRLINRDGSFNVRRRGLPFSQWFSGYHYLISMPWWKFNLMVVVAYICANLFFGAIYFLIGTDGLSGIDGHSLLERYLESVFFCTQTFTTVGFGRVSPVGMIANTVAAFESLCGLLSFALATGLLYGRFSRPIAKIIFSKNAVIAPYENGTGLMFRCANQRVNQLIDVTVTVTLSWVESLPNGQKTRRFHALQLERKSVTFFHLSWTVVHPIDENSPLWQISKDQLDESDAEILILLKAFDDSFAQTVHSRTSYKSQEVLYGRKFQPIINTGKDGITELDLGKINDMIEV